MFYFRRRQDFWVARISPVPDQVQILVNDLAAGRECWPTTVIVTEAAAQRRSLPSEAYWVIPVARTRALIMMSACQTSQVVVPDSGASRLDAEGLWRQ